MSDTPTPITDEAWAAWPYAGSGISVHVGRELERKLTAMTEQRDGLREGIDYATDQLTKVTEQRDRLEQALRKIADPDWMVTEMFAAFKIANEALKSLKQPTETKTKCRTTR